MRKLYKEICCVYWIQQTLSVENLARDLTLRHGRGFSRSNMIRFRQFYFAYPISATVSHPVSWSHIVTPFQGLRSPDKLVDES